jgi:outer membrane protein assembly factor BamB
VALALVVAPIVWCVRRPGWEGVHGVAFADVNGDGVVDFVGRDEGASGCSAAAFDGKTGKELWSAPRLGSYIETYQGTLGVAGDTVLFSMPTGELHAYRLKDGSLRWTTRLQDKADGFCKAHGNDQVLVEVGHKILTAVRLADGGVAPVPTDSGACVHWPGDAPQGDPGVEIREWSALHRPVGMNVSIALTAPGGSTVFIGSHETGTNVPMMAAADGSWRSDMPADRPLETSADGFPKAAITSHRVFAAYSFRQGDDERGLVAFDLDGHRLWEIRLESTRPLTAIQATEDRVFVSQWSELRAFDAATGKKVYAVGAF